MTTYGDTKLLRIELAGEPNLNERIKNTCNSEGQEGRFLAATFEAAGQLVLIFQKQQP